MEAHNNLFNKIISLENLFLSWKDFRRGKRKKFDVQTYERHLEDNLFVLHEELKNKTYRHGSYESFYINDPKLRRIHKAQVKDRIVHHAVYRILYPIFDRNFIFDSYSCRLNRGTHKAVFRLEKFAREVSRNYAKPCFALKCDVKKFFDSIDHRVLLELICRKVKDKDALWLIREIIESYSRERGEKGLPLGNLTSQLFANIYLNGFDQFVKHRLKIRHYLRYCDDFVILNGNRDYLLVLVELIELHLKNNLKLVLRQNKITVRKLSQGIDFLGYVTLPHYRVLRTKTKRRMLAKIDLKNLPSYLGLLKHCRGYELSNLVMDKVIE